MPLLSRCRIALLSAALLGCTQAVSAADLKVTVSGITEARGTLSALLIDSAEAWEGQGNPINGHRQVITATDPVQWVVKDLAPGQYAIRLMHDANDNGKLDSNPLGMPTEGYGFSNNPRVMRPATFDEARFELKAEGGEVVIALR